MIIFNSDDSACMHRALMEAWQQLQSGALVAGESESMAKAMLAKAIVDAAEQGEREEAKLVAYALSHYRQVRHSINGSGA